MEKCLASIPSPADPCPGPCLPNHLLWFSDVSYYVPTRVPELRCEGSLAELHQNSQKWKLSLWPTKLPLFVVNQLAKSSQVKKKKEKEKAAHFVVCDLLGPSAPHNGRACILGMSGSSHFICFYPKLPSGSAGPRNPDTTLPTLLVHYLWAPECTGGSSPAVPILGSWASIRVWKMSVLVILYLGCC